MEGGGSGNFGQIPKFDRFLVWMASLRLRGKNNSIQKKRFCLVKVGQFNGKFNSNQFSLLNFYSRLELMSELGNI